MKTILYFTITILFSLTSIFLKAQDFNIFKTNNLSNNILSDTINVLAGEIINLNIDIYEDKDTVFEVGSNKFVSLKLFNSVVFIDNPSFYKIPADGGDIGGFDTYGINTEQIKSKKVLIGSEVNIDKINIKDIKVKIPTYIDNNSYYILTVTQNLNDGTEITDTLLTFRYQKPVINIPVPHSA